ncbi:MAG TPA: YciI family protein [Candidatus Baltobacteraceae bacterium]
MQFLAITRRLTERFSDADFAAVLEPEAERARTLHSEGLFRSIFSRGDIPGAVIMLEANDLDEAQRIVGTLPFAQKGLMDVQLIELRPYRGFAPRGS